MNVQVYLDNHSRVHTMKLKLVHNSYRQAVTLWEKLYYEIKLFRAMANPQWAREFLYITIFYDFIRFCCYLFDGLLG